MTAPSVATGRDRRLCGGRLRQPSEAHDGDRCTRPAGWGTSHAGWGLCKLHLGSTAAGIAAAERERAQTETAAEVERLGLTVRTTPVDAMLDSLNRAYADVLVTGAKVAQLAPEDWKQLDSTNRFERPSVWVELYWRALDRYSDVASSCAKVGIEAAAVGLAHSYAQQLLAYTRALLTALGADPDAPEVVEHVQASLRAVEAGAA